MAEVIRTAGITALLDHLVDYARRKPWIALEGLSDKGYPRVEHRASRCEDRSCQPLPGEYTGDRAVVYVQVARDRVSAPAFDLRQTTDLGGQTQRDHVPDLPGPSAAVGSAGNRGG